MKLLSVFIPLFTSLATAIWPIPVSYEHGDTVLWITNNVQFYVHEAGAGNVGSIANQVSFAFASNSNAGAEQQVTHKDRSLRERITESSNRESAKSGHDDAVSGHKIIDYAINSAWTTILKRNFYPWKFQPREWDEPVITSTVIYISRVDINLLSADPQHIAKPLAGEVDESYTLDLTKDGKATIAANSSIGIARGLTTFTQLFYLQSNGESVYTPLAPVKIYDAPKFQHRGINLDVSRNWIPVDAIKRQIDAAAYNKMNRFHLHVTDSQSWPLEIPSIPELSTKGAYRPDLVYTASDFRDIQRHAAIQGVEVITEIDMPGHTSVIHYSFPDLIAAYNIQPDWDTYAAEPPSGTLKLNSTAVYDFLEKLFDDLLPRIYPYSGYFHTGGDEVNKMAYSRDDSVNSSDFAILQPLMQKFVDRNHDQVRKRGLTPVVWEEVLLEWNITLGNDVIVQSWQSDEAVAQIAGKGHKVLAGNYNYWVSLPCHIDHDEEFVTGHRNLPSYLPKTQLQFQMRSTLLTPTQYLDCGKGQWLDFDPSASASAYPYLDYCAPFHNWRLIYAYDPLSGVPEQHQHLVLGGEAHMWAEQTDAINLDRMIWPRGSAAAEVLWSGAKDATGRNRSQIDASPRLSEMRERLVGLGIGAEPIQMPYW